MANQCGHRVCLITLMNGWLTINCQAVSTSAQWQAFTKKREGVAVGVMMANSCECQGGDCRQTNWTDTK